MPGGPADLEIFIEAAAARNGLDNVAPAATDLRRTNGDNLIAKENDTIVHATCITAAIANATDWDIGMTSDRLKQTFIARACLRDQTDPCLRNYIADLYHKLIARANVQARVDNTNNAQIDAVVVIISKNGQTFYKSGPPPNTPLLFCNVTGGTALTSVVWGDVSLTWPALTAGQKYRIVGLAGDSATGFAMRLIFKDDEGQSKTRPGIPIGDTADGTEILWGDFGWFIGGNEPDAEWIASGTDSAQNLTAVLAPG